MSVACHLVSVLASVGAALSFWASVPARGVKWTAWALAALVFTFGAQLRAEVSELCLQGGELAVGQCRDEPEDALSREDSERVSAVGSNEARARGAVEVAPENEELGEDSEDRTGAPMCDPSAASVVAVPFVPDAQGGSVEELPCDSWGIGLSWAPIGELGVLGPGDAPEPTGRAHSASNYAVELDSPGLTHALPNAVHLRDTSIAGTDQQEHRRRIERPPLGL